MPTPLPDAGTGALHPDALPVLRERLAAADALVVGPGLGRSEATVRALLEVLHRLPCPAVVDADALNSVAGSGNVWKSIEQPVVVTPHPAEMGRLAGITTDAVQADRIGTAERFAQEHGVVVVLKGAETVVAATGHPTHIDRHRIVALATGGTGDVLAGLIGSLLAQGLSARDAAVAGVTVHAQAGVMVQARRGRAGALASDVIDTLPAAQELLRQALEAATARR
jgi:NAD(P)H-hydrate epimerase